MILVNDDVYLGLEEKVEVKTVNYFIGIHFDVAEVFSAGKRSKVTRYDILRYIITIRLLDEKDIERIMDIG